MHALKLVFISLLFSASIVWANEHCYLVITNARPEKNLIETVKIDWRGENLFLNFNSLEKGAHKIEEYTIKNRPIATKYSFQLQKREEDPFLSFSKRVFLTLEPDNATPGSDRYHIKTIVTGGYWIGPILIKTSKSCLGHGLEQNII